MAAKPLASWQQSCREVQSQDENGTRGHSQVVMYCSACRSATLGKSPVVGWRSGLGKAAREASMFSFDGHSYRHWASCRYWFERNPSRALQFSHPDALKIFRSQRIGGGYEYGVSFPVEFAQAIHLQFAFLTLVPKLESLLDDFLTALGDCYEGLCLEDLIASREAPKARGFSNFWLSFSCSVRVANSVMLQPGGV